MDPKSRKMTPDEKEKINIGKGRDNRVKRCYKIQFKKKVLQFSGKVAGERGIIRGTLRYCECCFFHVL